MTKATRAVLKTSTNFRNEQIVIVAATPNANRQEIGRIVQEVRKEPHQRADNVPFHAVVRNLAAVVVCNGQQDREQQPEKLTALLGERLVKKVANRHANEAFQIVFAERESGDTGDFLEALHRARPTFCSCDEFSARPRRPRPRHPLFHSGGQHRAGYRLTENSHPDSTSKLFANSDCSLSVRLPVAA